MSKTDGIGTWVWNNSLSSASSYGLVSFGYITPDEVNNVPYTSTITINNAKYIINSFEVGGNELNYTCSFTLDLSTDFGVRDFVYASSSQAVANGVSSGAGWYSAEDWVASDLDTPEAFTKYQVSEIDIKYIAKDTETDYISIFLSFLQANATYQEATTPTPSQYLDIEGTKQFTTKTKEYVDNKTAYRITNVVIGTDTINITIEPASGGGVVPEPTDGYTVTLNQGDPFGGDIQYCAYIVNGGTAQTLDATYPIVLTGVKTIEFAMDSGMVPTRGEGLGIGTTSGADDIANVANGASSGEIAITANVTYYVSTIEVIIDIE